MNFLTQWLHTYIAQKHVNPNHSNNNNVINKLAAQISSQRGPKISGITFSRILDCTSAGGITEESVVSDSSSIVVMIRNDFAISAKGINLYTCS